MSKQIFYTLLWNNASTNPGDVSEHILMTGFNKIQVFGNSATGVGHAQVQTSHDAITWYDSGQIIIMSAGSDFFGNFHNTGVYVRMKVDASFTGLTMRVNSEQQ